MPRPHDDPPSPRRAGSTLVLVMVFAVAAFGLVALVMLMSQKRVRAEADRSRLASLHAVLEAGVAHAMSEINRDHLDGPFDPGEDGVGALITGLDGKPGIPLLGGLGSVGRYRTTVDSTHPDGRLVLNVVAAYPDFASPNRLLIGAKLEVIPGEVRLHEGPLVVNGSAGGKATKPSDVKDLKIESGAFLSIVDPTFQYPAVNITDQVYYDAFLGQVSGGKVGIDLRGSDATTPGAPAVGVSTVANDSKTAYSPWAVGDLASGVDAYMTSQIPLGTSLSAAAAAQGATVKAGDDDHVHIESAGGGGPLRQTYTVPKGIYYVADDLKIDERVTLKGSGTLIVGKKLNIEDRGALEWDGEVLVGLDEKAELKVKERARLEVAGLLLVDAAKKKAKLTTEDRSALMVQGALLLLAAGEDEGVTSWLKAEFVVKSGSSVTVDGLLVIAGDHLHIKAEEQSELNVDGSVNLVMPPTNDVKGLHKLELKRQSVANLTWDQDKFDAASALLRDFSDRVYQGTGSPFPYAVSSYWEPAGVEVLDDQEAAIAAGETLGVP